MNRRKLILGGACLIAAPAIVKYECLMPVKKVMPSIQREMNAIWEQVKDGQPPFVFDISRIPSTFYPPVHKNGHLHLPGGLTPSFAREICDVQRMTGLWEDK